MRKPRKIRTRKLDLSGVLPSTRDVVIENIQRYLEELKNSGPLIDHRNFDHWWNIEEQSLTIVFPRWGDPYINSLLD